MNPLESLLLSTLAQPITEPYSFSSSKFDFNFIKYDKNIYFILSKNDETCLTGSVKNIDNQLSFEFNKENSSWLNFSSKVTKEKAILMLYNTYLFMNPVAKLRIKL